MFALDGLMAFAIINYVGGLSVFPRSVTEMPAQQLYVQIGVLE